VSDVIEVPDIIITTGTWLHPGIFDIVHGFNDKAFFYCPSLKCIVGKSDSGYTHPQEQTSQLNIAKPY
jgi:hypothetical protein